MSRAPGATINAGAVPDNFNFRMSYTQVISDNQIWALNNSAGRWMVANNEGPLLLNPLTANDPRVPICIGGTPACKVFDATQTRNTSFDNNFGPGSFLVQEVWPNREADISIATGTEARLIEAEVALRTGDVATFMAKLNLLRLNFDTFKQPSNPCSGDSSSKRLPAGCSWRGPSTAGLIRGLQMRKWISSSATRAFWLWSTAHRLADLRRLVRPVGEGGFGRAENTIFPNGPYYKGGIYGTDKFLIIPQAEQNNPQFHGCLDRNP